MHRTNKTIIMIIGPRVNPPTIPSPVNNPFFAESAEEFFCFAILTNLR